MVIGEKIKNLRLSCELTQEELADRCELTKGYISQLENDLTSPSIATLIDILSALGIFSPGTCCRRCTGYGHSPQSPE